MFVGKVWLFFAIAALAAPVVSSEDVSGVETQTGGQTAPRRMLGAQVPQVPPFFAGNMRPVGLPDTERGREIKQTVGDDPPGTPPYYVSLFDPVENTAFYSAYKVTPEQANALGTFGRQAVKKVDWRTPGVPGLNKAYGRAIELTRPNPQSSPKPLIKPKPPRKTKPLGKPKRLRKINPMMTGLQKLKILNRIMNKKISKSKQISKTKPPRNLTPLTRGHMNPVVLNTFNQRFMRATFDLSNAVPQFEEFNGKYWADFETRIANYAKTCGARGGTLYLLTGKSKFGLTLDFSGKPVQDTEISLPFTEHEFFGVNLVTPRAIWTAGCCVGVGPGGAESFAVMSNNQQNPALLHQTEMSVTKLEGLLRAPFSAEVNLFPGAGNCRVAANNKILPR